MVQVNWTFQAKFINHNCHPESQDPEKRGAHSEMTIHHYHSLMFFYILNDILILLISFKCLLMKYLRKVVIGTTEGRKDLHRPAPLLINIPVYCN
jgi:hypothetical protein